MVTDWVCVNFLQSNLHHSEPAPEVSVAKGDWKQDATVVKNFVSLAVILACQRKLLEPAAG